MRGCGDINGVNNTVAERKKCGENVEWQGREKKVDEHRPTRPSRNTRPWLHNGPPEKKSGPEETGVLDRMPRPRLQSQRECCRNMPSQQCCGGGEPAKRRLRKYTSNSLHRRRPKQWTENGLQEFPGQSVQQRHHGCAHQDQRRSDGHEQQMLNHVDGQQFLVEGCERGTHCHPDQEQSEKKTASSPGRNRVHGSRMKTNPSRQLQDPRQNDCESRPTPPHPALQ